MILTLILFIVGFIGLIWGADVLIRNTTFLGKKYNLSQIVLGIILIGFGTSLPELIISAIAAIKNSSDISVSNVIGSNIANILLIVGLVSLLTHINIPTRDILRFEIPFLFFTAILLFFLANSYEMQQPGKLNRFEGFIFLISFFVFLYYTIKKNPNTEVIRFKYVFKKMPLWKLLINIIIGLVALLVGGRMVVVYAIQIAQWLGMSEAFIGVTILAVGSSLPELITSLVAARKNQLEMSIGNIIGSNIFNTFFILGIASLFNPLTISTEQKGNIIFSIFVTFLFFVYLKVMKHRKKQIFISTLFLVFYVVFILGSYFGWTMRTT